MRRQDRSVGLHDEPTSVVPQSPGFHTGLGHIDGAERIALPVKRAQLVRDLLEEFDVLGGEGVGEAFLDVERSDDLVV